MACATLKRHLEWDPVMSSRPSKRRRCLPFCHTPPSKPSPSAAASTARHDALIPRKPSPFADVVAAKITPEKMAASIRDEFRRMQKRKQLQFCNSNSNQSDLSEGNSSGGEQSSEAHTSRSERALFTFKQVGLICERMVRERETELREEYDKVLSAKLAEQYDAFVKFTYDQIQKRYEATPSYLS